LWQAGRIEGRRKRAEGRGQKEEGRKEEGGDGGFETEDEGICFADH
jgi:hypothetical protein